jgi:hypothetical protein
MKDATQHQLDKTRGAAQLGRLLDSITLSR